MKKLVLSLFVALLSLGFAADHVEAKRLGGGSSSGMKRQMPARQSNDAVPAQQAPKQGVAPANAATPATAAPKRSWMGPLAGLAAGLGIAALMSHLGMGAEFGNILMMVLLGVGALIAVRFVMQRFASQGAGRAATAGPQGMQYAGAGAGFPSPSNMPAQPQQPFNTGSSMLSGPSFASVAAGDVAPSLPPGFDAAGFERIAKLIFIRMQAANDAANLEDLRQFSTPEMFAVFRLDLQDRKAGTQQTDVERLDAQVLDFAEDATQQIVSVRFHGLIREEQDQSAAAFDEVWHLVKPKAGDGEWAIAGIAQSA